MTKSDGKKSKDQTVSSKKTKKTHADVLSYWTDEAMRSAKPLKLERDGRPPGKKKGTKDG